MWPCFKNKFIFKTRQRPGFDLWVLCWPLVSTHVIPVHSPNPCNPMPLSWAPDNHCSFHLFATKPCPCPSRPFCWSLSCLKLSKAMCLLSVSPLTIHGLFLFPLLGVHIFRPPLLIPTHHPPNPLSGALWPSSPLFNMLWSELVSCTCVCIISS